MSSEGLRIRGTYLRLEFVVDASISDERRAEAWTLGDWCPCHANESEIEARRSKVPCAVILWWEDRLSCDVFET